MVQMTLIMSVVPGKLFLRIRSFCGCGISVASLLCCSPLLQVCCIDKEALFLFLLPLTMVLGLFAVVLFYFFISDFSLFTVLMGISAPAPLQHMSFLKCCFSFCALYKAVFTFDSYFFVYKGNGQARYFLEAFLAQPFFFIFLPSLGSTSTGNSRAARWAFVLCFSYTLGGI